MGIRGPSRATLPQTPQHAGFRLIDCRQAQTHRGGDLGGRLAFDYDPPKNLPRSVLEFHADHVQHPTGESGVGFQRLIEEDGSEFRPIEQPPIGVRAPFSIRPALPPAKMVADLISGDRSQPGPKTVAGPVAAELIDVGRHGAKHSWATLAAWASLTPSCRHQR